MAQRPSAEGRLLELLADRATEGLTAGETEELGRLLASAPEVDPSAFDLAAAAVHLTAPFSKEAIPAGLEAKLQQRAAEFVAGLAPSSVVPEPVAVFRRPRSVDGGWVQQLGWYAAAACLAAAIVGWWPGRRISPPPEPPPPVAVAPKPPTFASVAAAADALRLEWTGTEDPAAAGVGGEIVWSGGQQKGFMRFTGLPVNDPGEYQYQLWIFDANQDERYPIDGGVFNAGTGETVVPISAKLAVTQPGLFAVTVEKPGGVVVSSRERIVLVAAVS